MDNIKVINKIIDLQLNEINKLNKLDIEYLEKQYKRYTAEMLDIKDKLDKTPKIFKHKKKNLSEQYNALKDKADNYYAKYLEEIESLYNMEMLGGGKDD